MRAWPLFPRHDRSAGSVGMVPIDPMNHRARITGIPLWLKGTGCSRRQPTQVRSAAIDFAYGVTATRPPASGADGTLRRPDSLRVLAHELLDNVEEDGSDRQCRFRQRKVIRGAKRYRCFDHGARQTPDIGSGKTRGADGDGSRKYRGTKPIHDGRAERRNRLDFGDDLGCDPRPRQRFIDQSAQEVPPATAAAHRQALKAAAVRPMAYRTLCPEETPETVLPGTEAEALPP